MTDQFLSKTLYNQGFYSAHPHSQKPYLRSLLSSHYCRLDTLAFTVVKQHVQNGRNDKKNDITTFRSFLPFFLYEKKNATATAFNKLTETGTAYQLKSLLLTLKNVQL